MSAQSLMRYFKETLGYGYKCSKCKKEGKITTVTSSGVVSFVCNECKKRWGFQLKVVVK